MKLPTTFKGSVLAPEDADYAQAKQIWNTLRSDQRPRLIAKAVDAEDVKVAIAYACAHDLSIAVRGGGHGIDCAAMADDALVIDMSLMKQVRVDTASGQVRVQAGVLLGEMDAATQAHGLVVPAGTVSTTGAAGLTLGGGIGHLTRRFGATVDSLLSVDVVTTDGQVITAHAGAYDELFWGLRGAGHNLAVATSFTFQGHRVGPDVISGIQIYGAEEARALLSGVDEAMASSPRELSIPLVLVPAPPLPQMPTELVGTPVLVALVIYTGPPQRYEEAMRQFSALARPMSDEVGPSSWLEANALVDRFEPPERRYHSGGGFMRALNGDIAEIALDRIAAAPPPTSPATSCIITFPMLGGALNDFAEESVAFSRAGAEWLSESIGIWDDPAADDDYLAWVADTVQALATHTSANGYVNLTSDRGPTWLRGVYGAPEKWERIVALKQAWDPDNRLCHNKNVARAAAERVQPIGRR